MNFETYFAVSADPYYYAALAVDFILLFAMLVLVRTLFGRTSGGVDTTVELSENDNHAFGISLGGATAALAVVFAGVASGDIATNLITEGLYVLGYGVLGVVMLILSLLTIGFPQIDLKQMISQGNIAAGTLDAGNMIATAIIIFGVFAWSTGDWLSSIGVVVGMYLVTQLLLVLISRYRVNLFAKRNKGRFFRDAINEGNVALAIRFAGFQIGTALAISTSGNLVVFGSDLVLSIVSWAVVAFVLLIGVIVLTITDRESCSIRNICRTRSRPRSELWRCCG